MKEIDIRDLEWSPYKGFADEWMLLSAGNEGEFNAMTVAWGQTGALWDCVDRPGHIPVATAYVRPQRYTKEFMDREGYFALSCFGGAKKKELAYMGSHSGRYVDKVKETGLTPVFSDGTVYFAEASLVLICRKLYQAPIVEGGFVDKSLIDRNYPEKDYHEMYIGEIVKVYQA